jgi:hypothetical protein
MLNAGYFQEDGVISRIAMAVLIHLGRSRLRKWRQPAADYPGCGAPANIIAVLKRLCKISHYFVGRNGKSIFKFVRI